VDMVDMTKFLGDTSLNNESFVEYQSWGKLAASFGHAKCRKAFSFKRLRPPDLHRGLCPLDAR